MNKVAITGADGFIGTKLISTLKRKNIDIKSFDHNIHSLEKINSLEKLISGSDTVYHLAGLTNPNDPNLFKVNLLGTLNLLAAMQSKVPNAKLIFASSFAVYYPPQHKSLVAEDSKIHPRNNYGLSKLLAEQAIINYHGLKTKPVILRFSNIYGPGMRPNAHSVVANFFDSISKSHEISLYRDGKDTRDFVYIDDAIDALVTAPQKGIGGVYNICSGEEISVLNLFQKISKFTNKMVHVNNVESADKSSFWKGDYTKAKKDMKWEPKITIEEGLKKIWQEKK